MVLSINFCIGSLLSSRSVIVREGAVLKTVAAMFALWRRCFQRTTTTDGMFIRDAPLMNHTYDTEQGLIVSADHYWGIMASQGLHGYRETCDERRPNDWFNTQYEDAVSIDVKRGGMSINHDYTTSMYTEGTKYIDSDGRLLDNYK